MSSSDVIKACVKLRINPDKTIRSGERAEGQNSTSLSSLIAAFHCKQTTTESKKEHSRAKTFTEEAQEEVS